MIENVKMYKEVENNKASLIVTIGDKKVYAVSCPTIGDEYRALLLVRYTDNEKEVNYRYDLLTGKQVLIEDEYSTLPVKFLRTLEAVLATPYHRAGAEKSNTLYKSLLYTIDNLNQNTENWVSVLEDEKYANIPKFSNRRKPRSTTSK